MPELPEAESARRLLQRLLKGKRIVSAAARPDPIVFAGTPGARVAAALTGRTVRAAHRKGKHMWLELDRRPWPAFHFGMSGWFEVYDTPAQRPGHWKLELLAGGRRIAFSDVRRFGRIRLQQDPAGEPPISELGFDPLEGLPETAELARHLARRSAPIKAVLLDQSLFAGVGNWIADEVLFQSGISPHRRARDLGRDEVARLRRAMHADHRAGGPQRRRLEALPEGMAVPSALGLPRRPAHVTGRVDRPRDDRRPHRGLGSDPPALAGAPSVP